MNRQLKTIMMVAVVMAVAVVLAACGGNKGPKLNSLTMENLSIRIVEGSSGTLKPVVDASDYSKSNLKWYVVLEGEDGEEPALIEENTDGAVLDYVTDVTFKIDASTKVLTIETAEDAAGEDGDITYTIRAELDGKTKDATVEIVSQEVVDQEAADAFMAANKALIEIIAKGKQETTDLDAIKTLKSAYEALSEDAPDVFGLVKEMPVKNENDEDVTVADVMAGIGGVIAGLEDQAAAEAFVESNSTLLELIAAEDYKADYIQDLATLEALQDGYNALVAKVYASGLTVVGDTTVGEVMNKLDGIISDLQAQADAAAFIDGHSALLTKLADEEVTVDDLAALNDLRTAYIALSAEVKAIVDENTAMAGIDAVIENLTQALENEVETFMSSGNFDLMYAIATHPESYSDASDLEYLLPLQDAYTELSPAAKGIVNFEVIVDATEEDPAFTVADVMSRLDDLITVLRGE